MPSINPFLLGGTSEDTIKYQKKYIRYFKESEKILDIGCGRGEFMKLVEAEGKEAFGVDLSEISINECKKKGLNVVKDDVFNYLRSSKTTFDGIFCAHLIEHLPGDSAFELINLCCKNLNDNGIIIFLTPNFKDLRVITNIFWLDLEHIRPYPIALLERLFTDNDLEIIESGEDSETPPKDNVLLAGIPELFDIHKSNSKIKSWIFKVLFSDYMSAYKKIHGKLIKMEQLHHKLIELLSDKGDSFVVARKSSK